MCRSYLVLAAVLAALLPVHRAEAQTCGAIANCDSCPNPSICDACQTGRFFVVPPGGSPTCQVCTVCQTGEVEISPCSPFIDRQCGVACPSGTIDVGGACQDCGVFDCATCSAPGTCTACASGFFLDAGACWPCTTCNAGESVATACSATLDATCTPCAAGTYSDAPASAMCTDCSPGSYSSAGATACMACGTGTIAANPASDVCAACPSGTAPNAAATACEALCGDGTLLSPNEECDDGNTMDGDGCSVTCTVEAGWTCGLPDTPCDQTFSGGGGGGCSSAGDDLPPLPWLAIPIALAFFAWSRRRSA